VCICKTKDVINLKKNINLKKKFYIITAIVVLIAAITIIKINNTKKSYRPYISSSYLLTNFSIEYIDANKGEIIIDIPPAFELLYIILAIGTDDPGSVNRQTEYYEKVKNHFSPYKEHPVVSKIVTSVYSKSVASVGTIFAYGFDGDSIKHNDQHSVSGYADSYMSYLDEFEQFAILTGFLDFYKENKQYYEELIDEYKKTVPIKQMWQWLETVFPQRYDTYRIVSSPLMGGSHYTHNFRDKQNGYNEIVAFVPIITSLSQSDSDLDINLTEIILSRFAFTEFDHQYVNPETDRLKNLKKVVDIFLNRDKWYEGLSYEGPSLIFNEYMTWAVFGLYIFDNYDTKTYDITRNITVNTMVDYRKFILFEHFNDKLLELYIEQKGEKSVADLYGAILKYSKQLNK